MSVCKGEAFSLQIQIVMRPESVVTACLVQLPVVAEFKFMCALKVEC